MKGEKCGERCGQFKILPQDMPRGTEKNYENLMQNRKDSNPGDQDEQLSILALIFSNGKMMQN
jgi:hypothetical protein